jgi:uncharacterized membrane protein
MIGGLTPFGVFHTAVSILPIGFGLYALVRDGKIDPRNGLGQLYVLTMLVGCITGLMIYHHGGFGPGHVLSIIPLLLVLVGALAGRGNWFGRATSYVETICLSTSYFFLMFFFTTESLTRLPPDHPYAASADAPELLPVRLVLLVLLVAGIGFQVVRLRAAHRH